MHNKNKILIISLLILGIIIFSFFIFKKQKTEKQIPSVQNNENIYTDKSGTFSFSYPNQFTVIKGNAKSSTDWRINSPDMGTILATVEIPKSFLPQTNFGEAKFTVGTSSDPNAINECLIVNHGNMETSKEVTINSKNFVVISFNDVGAGNYYDTTSYRIIYNKQCYALEYTIHSSNIYNYSPDQNIKVFDKEKIDSTLESIVQSFKFL